MTKLKKLAQHIAQTLDQKAMEVLTGSTVSTLSDEESQTLTLDKFQNAIKAVQKLTPNPRVMAIVVSKYHQGLLEVAVENESFYLVGKEWWKKHKTEMMRILNRGYDRVYVPAFEGIPVYEEGDDLARYLFEKIAERNRSLWLNPIDDQNLLDNSKDI